MFFLSFTTPAKRRHRGVVRQAPVMPPPHQTIITAALIFLWLVLMVFGSVTYVGPEWLRELSDPGRRVEAIILKSYGDNYYRKGDYGMAAGQYRGALDRNPDLFDARLNLALSLDKLGRTREAISILTKMLQRETSPRQKEAVCHNLGSLSAREGKTDEAIGYLEQAAVVSFDQRPFLAKLGSLYLDAGQFEKAAETLERALAIRLDVTLSYRSTLRAALDNDEYKSDKERQAAIEERLSDDIGEEQLARYDLQIIRSMQESDTEIADIHNKLAYICMRSGKNDEAISHMQKVLEIMPDHEGAKRNLQALLQKTQTTDKTRSD
ncbi:MAG: tetratricopeptide repeat protein [Phycisphaerales bacterium]|nr:MAG: tetratricopeptide repeat protein [Phycisphaerales bacterium]